MDLIGEVGGIIFAHSGSHYFVGRGKVYHSVVDTGSTVLFGESYNLCKDKMYESQFRLWFLNAFLPFLDPPESNKQLHVVADDLLEELNQLWDKLPVDTIIATLLDPRTKWYDKIPKEEIKEALSILKQVPKRNIYLNLTDMKDFVEMVRHAEELKSMEVENEKLPEKDIYALMFEDLTHNSRKLSPLQLWNQEINAYQAMPRANYKFEPLLWWKSNIGQLPNLGILLFMVYW